MTARYDVLAARTFKDRDGNEKTSFTRVGVAFPMRDREGFSIQLEAIPAPQDGAFKLLMMPPKPREDVEERPARKPQGKPATSYDEMDDSDSIPF